MKQTVRLHVLRVGLIVLVLRAAVCVASAAEPAPPLNESALQTAVADTNHLKLWEQVKSRKGYYDVYKDNECMEKDVKIVKAVSIDDKPSSPKTIVTVGIAVYNLYPKHTA